jgi:hypothetical protein
MLDWGSSQPAPAEATMFAIVTLVLGTMTATIVLLAIGYHFGCQVKSATKASSVAVARGGPSPQLMVCLESAETLQASIRVALETAARHRTTAPADLLRAIDQLVVATQRLSSQLTHALELPHQEQGTCLGHSAKEHPLPARVTEKTEERAPSGANGVTLQASNHVLSAEEMQQLTSSNCNFSVEHSPKRRYSYDAHQRVIPMDAAASVPCVEIAARVRCHDISVHGISFFWPGDPDFDRLVISLGADENPIWTMAEVMQSKAVFMHDEIRTLVGCRFIGRYNWPNNQPSRLGGLEYGLANCSTVISA